MAILTKALEKIGLNRVLERAAQSGGGVQSAVKSLEAEPIERILGGAVRPGTPVREMSEELLSKGMTSEMRMGVDKAVPPTLMRQNPQSVAEADPLLELEMRLRGAGIGGEVRGQSSLGTRGQQNFLEYGKLNPETTMTGSPTDIARTFASNPREYTLIDPANVGSEARVWQLGDEGVSTVKNVSALDMTKDSPISKYVDFQAQMMENPENIMEVMTYAKEAHNIWHQYLAPTATGRKVVGKHIAAAEKGEKVKGSFARAVSEETDPVLREMKKEFAVANPLDEFREMLYGVTKKNKAGKVVRDEKGRPLWEKKPLRILDSQGDNIVEGLGKEGTEKQLFAHLWSMFKMIPREELKVDLKTEGILPVLPWLERVNKYVSKLYDVEEQARSFIESVKGGKILSPTEQMKVFGERKSKVTSYMGGAFKKMESDKRQLFEDLSQEGREKFLEVANAGVVAQKGSRRVPGVKHNLQSIDELGELSVPEMEQVIETTVTMEKEVGRALKEQVKRGNLSDDMVELYYSADPGALDILKATEKVKNKGLSIPLKGRGIDSVEQIRRDAEGLANKKFPDGGEKWQIYFIQELKERLLKAIQATQRFSGKPKVSIEGTTLEELMGSASDYSHSLRRKVPPKFKRKEKDFVSDYDMMIMEAAKRARGGIGKEVPMEGGVYHPEGNVPPRRWPGSYPITRSGGYGGITTAGVGGLGLIELMRRRALGEQNA